MLDAAQLTSPRRIAELLQPDVVVSLGQAVCGPLDLLRLRETLAARRTPSTGSAQADQPTISRPVRLTRETWDALRDMGQQLGEAGSSSTPTHVAELLVEVSVARWRERGRTGERVGAET
ncbi:MAG: hypothetical protein COZ06_32565 [Armatimonadetes bacterium CG_4_10_14_3_um_filter_66_18]|nr:hypothetical protein [Armatimonadota bacterium]OIO95384.1 MAG: hypothetical protein AUJ96_26785 [Armatimonadetes bacterium CG2_30_66_41]PIU91844.1 MAG: hypothetical protein COS65_20465 [Armatimonadetes bacterium CG06_land_8_20_14_3_00_66_21]PIW13042.1 MAG: hypothetical protein COW34_11805 [Armatimonadetes bacterium CG17_big_fil_post_rev_8_21_14_2_50_66_6]PIX46786.1 MAG: hypothetical protein COZ57_10325 [Armatimonadetes bacterium CG_4_8_14_3_um_filter_66_20]PIY37572.1 MAG: hypothetical prote